VKKLRVGQRVTAIRSGGEWQGRVRRGIGSQAAWATNGPTDRLLTADEEGITWARGWCGEAVDALRAYIALTERRRPELGSIGEFIRSTYKRYQALPPPQKIAVTAAAAAVAEVAISALAVPLARKT
jgi:hypothetical protein